MLRPNSSPRMERTRGECPAVADVLTTGGIGPQRRRHAQEATATANTTVGIGIAAVGGCAPGLLSDRPKGNYGRRRRRRLTVGESRSSARSTPVDHCGSSSPEGRLSTSSAAHSRQKRISWPVSRISPAASSSCGRRPDHLCSLWGVTRICPGLAWWAGPSLLDDEWAAPAWPLREGRRSRVRNHQPTAVTARQQSVRTSAAVTDAHCWSTPRAVGPGPNP